MKLFIFRNPANLECAMVSPVGDTGYVKCDYCNHYDLMDFPQPTERKVEWLEGSDRICSFVWPSRLIAEVMVTEAVERALQLSGVNFIPIEFYQDPKLKRPKRITKRSRLRVWLPYHGPPLYALWATAWVHADLTRSSLKVRNVCSVCGNTVFEVEGIEERGHRYDLAEKRLALVQKTREEGKGIYVRSNDLQNADIFRVYEFPGRLFCNERVKLVIEESQFTNIWMLEVGETL